MALLIAALKLGMLVLQTLVVVGQAQDDLYAVGPMTRGAFWEVTSVPDIRIQAAEVAQVIAVSAG